MTRAPTDRSHLSIGEVLSLLQEDFPDITISKIRFLESQGLLDPERTPSGYRKFYEADIDRLRWILKQQKEHYLPLKVIKDRLDEIGSIRTAPTAAGPLDASDDPPATNGVAPAALHDSAAGPAGGVAANGERAPVGVALDDRPAQDAPAERPAVHARRVEAADPPAARPAPTPARTRPQPGRRPDVADVIEAPPRPAARTSDDPTLLLSPGRSEAGRGRSAASTSRAAADPGSVSLTADELIQASGLSARDVRELEGYGLIEPHHVGDAVYYDGDALIIARTAAGFLEHGIEARHIRSYKVAVEREAGLFEQIVLPLLKQRNPEAKRRAAQTIAELMRLGDEMRGVLLRRGLREHIPPGP